MQVSFYIILNSFTSYRNAVRKLELRKIHAGQVYIPLTVSVAFIGNIKPVIACSAGVLVFCFLRT